MGGSVAFDGLAEGDLDGLALAIKVGWLEG